jgi:hypothetical protein
MVRMVANGVSAESPVPGLGSWRLIESYMDRLDSIGLPPRIARVTDIGTICGRRRSGVTLQNVAT